MKRILALLTSFIISSSILHAQEVNTTESWSGAITIGTNKLNIGFNLLSLSDGKQACTMDVPEQGANNIPTEIIKNDADSLSISITALRATYKGHKNSAESIVGQFSQNGMSFPLSLTPGKVELIRPQTPKQPYPYATEEVVFKNETEGAVLSGTLTYPITYGFQAKETRYYSS